MSFAPLQLADGPPCPSCGCRDAEILREAPAPEAEGWWGPQGSGLAHCRCCDNQFTFRIEPAPDPAAVDEALAGMEFEAADIEPVDTPPKPRDTAYPVRECPKCGAAETRVVSSGKKPASGCPRIRYHQCKACGENFKSTDSRHCQT